MVSIWNSIYVIGGEYDSSTSHHSLSSNYQFNHGTNSWTSKASYPYPITKSGILVDGNRIWIFGGVEIGYSKLPYVYYYLVDKDTWHHHSDLPYAENDNTCQVVFNQYWAKRIYCVLGHRTDSIWYYDLSYNTGWTHLGNLRNAYTQHYMSMISFNMFNAILVGGYSELNEVSTRNLWVWDPKFYRFHQKYYYLQSAAKDGFWTAVRKTRKFRAIQNCDSESRTYAAVGWGGFTLDNKDFRTKWHVFHRKRLDGDGNKLATCHGIIPDLIPGRRKPMITVVGYKLIVCGVPRPGF